MLLRVKCVLMSPISTNYFLVEFRSSREENFISFLKEDDFTGLTNFTMKFIRKINHEKEPDFNGFIVKVAIQPLAGNG